MAWDLLNKRLLTSIFFISLFSAPALAADSTTTGIVAGLGVTAATGKSSVGGGGGQIEASILVSDAILRAGNSIRKLVTQSLSQHSAPINATVLLLGHSDTVDLSTARWLPIEIEQAEKNAKGMTAAPATCDPAPAKSLPPHVNPLFPKMIALNVSGSTVKPELPDLAAAIMTDTDVEGISLTADDRMLVNAIEMGGASGSAQKWHSTDAPLITSTPAATFVVPGQLVDVDPTKGIIQQLAEFEEWINLKRHCSTAEFKAAITYADAFVASVAGADKGPPPVIVAAELEPFIKAGAHPYILRVAIESIGGTSVSRNNIWYAFGYPGAVQISSGLLVSFRLFDPQTGTDLLMGEVRCMIKPTNLTNVHKMMVTDPHDTNNDSLAPPPASCGYSLG